MKKRLIYHLPIILLILFCHISPTSSQQATSIDTGNIRGVVYRRGSTQPLVNADISLAETSQQSMTDSGGVFEFKDLPPGQYRIRVFSSGYCALEDTVCSVEPGRTSQLEIYLEKTQLLFEEVLVTTQRFITTVSRQSMHGMEINRIAGTAGDALRALQALPSVGVANDFDGSLYIRGGGPDDNVFYFDRSPIGYPYHFGGLVSTLSSEVIERIDVYAGGFGAEFGADAQAVIDIYSRSGNRKNVSGKFNLNLIYAEGLLEGPIGLRGSWYLGGRRSYVDLLPIEVNRITAFPRFWDYQFKATYDLNTKHKITVNAFAADDFMELKLGLDDVNDDPALAGKFLFKNGFDGQGVHLQSRFTDRLTSYLSLSRSFNHFNLSLGQGFFLRIGIPNYEFRQDTIYRFVPKHRLEFGLLLATAPVTGSAFFPRRPDEGDPGFNFTFAEKIRDEFRVRYNRTEGYLQNRYSPFTFLAIALGLRIDHLNLTNEISFGPRASLKFRIPSGSEICVAYGRYEQSPQPPRNFPGFGNPDVKSSEANHYILEVEHQLSSKTGLKVAGYYRKLSNLVTSDSQAIYLNQGDGFARGVELFLRHHGGERFLGWASYACTRSERRDRPHNPWRLYSFDQTHVGTFTGSYKLSPTWEIGAKWQYSTGNPYTPVTGTTVERHPTKGRLTYRPTYADINSERVPSFHRLDLRVSKSFVFKYWKMGVYLELLNAYNRKNILTFDYNDDYTERDVVHQLPLIPYLGVTASF